MFFADGKVVRKEISKTTLTWLRQDKGSDKKKQERGSKYEWIPTRKILKFWENKKGEKVGLLIP